MWCFIHPFYSFNGVVRWPAPYSSLTNLTPQPLFPRSPLPIPYPPLSPFFPTSLYKANETEVGPLFTGGGDREKGGHKQAGKESSSLFVHTGALLHVLGGLSVSQNKHFAHIHTRCDTASECDIRTCVCLYVTQSFSQAPVLCDSTQVSFMKWLFISPLCFTICLCLLHRHDTPVPPTLVLSIWL